MAFISNFVIFSLIISLLYFIGLLTFITDYEENKCQMTYMFEYPQFVKIGVPRAEKYQRYGLYAYSEGRFTEKARATKFDGIPVLFIPGNAGSYKQVRSLASVALRKAVNSRSKFHFDFFAVDLNNELSGLNGALLDEQTVFVNESIYRILDLYQDDKPNSIALIGHSMGGVIAHSLLLNNANIDLLVSLASPHRKPSICLDYRMKQYYDELQAKISPVASINKTFISIAGGNFDHLVHSSLTNVDSNSLNVVTTAVPTVWLSTDHQCIVWCKQLVLALVRALFDAVDPNTKQLSSDHRLRLAAFKYHLLTNSGINLQQAARYKTGARFDPRGDWHEDLRRQYSILVPKNRNQIQYLMIRFFDDPKYQILYIRIDNLMYSDWIFVCSANVIQGSSRICEDGIHLSHRSELMPTLLNVQNRPKLFHIDLFKLKKRYPETSHVLIKILPQPEPVTIHFDIHNAHERYIHVDLPNWYSLSRKYIIKETPKKHMRYVLEMSGLQHLIQTYLLYVEPINCESISNHASVKFYVPWAQHDTYSFVNEGTKKPLLLRLFNSKPSSARNLTAKVILNLDPTCQYSISVRNSFVGMLAQLARYYSPMLLSNVAAVVLVTYYSQMNSLAEKSRCVIFQTALSVDTKPYYLVTVAKLISRFLVMGRFADIFTKPDGQYLLEENVDFLLLPLVLYLTAVGLTYLISIVLWSVLILSESTVHRLAAKGVTKTFGGAVKLSDWFLNALHKMPCIVAFILFSLGLSTCGGMALALGSVYYFLKLTQMGQEYVEGLVYKFIGKITSKLVQLFSKKKKTEPEISENDSIDGIQTPVLQDQHETDDTITTDSNEKIEKCVSGNTDKDDHWEDLELIDNEEIEELLQTENDDEKIDNKTNESIDDISDKKTDDVKAVETAQEESEKMQLVKFENANENSQESTKSQKNDDAKNKNCHDSIHFHFTLFLLWFLVMLINIPSVLTWARNFQYSNVLSPDPSIIPGVVLSLCAAFLWQMEIPKRNKLYYKEVGTFLYFMAIVCLIYTPIHIYRLNYILTVVICVVTLHQLFGPEQTEESTTQLDDNLPIEKDPIEHVAEIKSKID